MKALWQTYSIIPQCIELHCRNLANCLTFLSTWDICKSFGVLVVGGASSPHIKFWHPVFVSKNNQARKLKFGVPLDRY